MGGDGGCGDVNLDRRSLAHSLLGEHSGVLDCPRSAWTCKNPPPPSQLSPKLVEQFANGFPSSWQKLLFKRKSVSDKSAPSSNQAAPSLFDQTDPFTASEQAGDAGASVNAVMKAQQHEDDCPPQVFASPIEASASQSGGKQNTALQKREAMVMARSGESRAARHPQIGVIREGLMNSSYASGKEELEPAIANAVVAGNAVVYTTAADTGHLSAENNPDSRGQVRQLEGSPVVKRRVSAIRRAPKMNAEPTSRFTPLPVGAETSAPPGKADPTLFSEAMPSKEQGLKYDPGNKRKMIKLVSVGMDKVVTSETDCKGKGISSEASCQGKGSASDAADKKSGEQFDFGQRVSVRFKGRPPRYPGTICAVNEDGTYGVDYDDGDREDAVLPKHMRLERKRPKADGPPDGQVAQPASQSKQHRSSKKLTQTQRGARAQLNGGSTLSQRERRASKATAKTEQRASPASDRGVQEGFQSTQVKSGVKACANYTEDCVPSRLKPRSDTAKTDEDAVGGASRHDGLSKRPTAPSDDANQRTTASPQVKLTRSGRLSLRPLAFWANQVASNLAFRACVICFLLEF